MNNVSLKKLQCIDLIDKVLHQHHTFRLGGKEVKYFCVFCNHKEKKLEINVDESSLKFGWWHCWHCDKSGNLRTLFRELNAPESYYLVLDELYPSKKRNIRKSGNDLKDLFDVKVGVEETHALPSEFISLYEPSRSIEYKNALRYLKRRGITEYDILRYNIGYCEDGDFRNRVIIPSYDKDGDLNFYTGRNYYESNWMPYKNCTYSKNIIGFESFINWNLPISLVEGAFDGISVRHNCIPLFGKTLSKKLEMELILSKPPRVNVLLDNDALKSAVDICDFLIKNNIKTYLVRMDEIKDPSIMGFEKTTELINNTKEIGFKELFKLKLSL